MALPLPEPGLVISYAYLWLSEHRTGQEEGLKDRPCAIVVATTDDDGEQVVFVCPITHTPPGDPDDSVEIPSETKKRLGLDGERSWIVVSEVNRFVWPGPDLRPTPNGNYAYGFLPRSLFRRVREALLNVSKKRRLGAVGRTE